VNGPLLEEDRELERRRTFPIATIANEKYSTLEQSCEEKGVVVAASVTLNGTIPTEMGLLEYLERAKPLRNILSGAIPTEMGELDRELNYFYVEDNNDLSSTIPSELGLLENLEELNLANIVCQSSKLTHFDACLMISLEQSQPR